MFSSVFLCFPVFSYVFFCRPPVFLYFPLYSPVFLCLSLLFSYVSPFFPLPPCFCISLPCFCMFFPVFLCFSLFLFVFPSFSPFLYVFLRFPLFFPVFLCFSLLRLFGVMSLHVSKSQHLYNKLANASLPFFTLWILQAIQDVKAVVFTFLRYFPSITGMVVCLP